MQLDYKDIIIKHYALSMSGSEIARQTGASKSGVNDFLRAFKKCKELKYPLPSGITNYGIAMIVYGSVPGAGGRNENIELPDYEEAAKLMATRKNMTLMFLWNRYLKWELIILDDFLLHTITDEREIKILFELLEKRNERQKSTIVCSQRDPDSWKAMILNDEVSANSIMKRATKHYTIKINIR